MTVPFGYSLRDSLGPRSGVPVEAPTATRSSTYLGGTISYSYGQEHAWYLDVAFAEGNSSGSQGIVVGTLGDLNSNFSIKDEWYQAYVRYTFPGLSGRRFSAYLRAGGTYVNATLDVKSTIPSLGAYTQHTKSTDLLGNLGLGGRYSLYAKGKFRLGAQVEIEGFFGSRSQDSLENLAQDTGLTFKSHHLDNTLYGGIGRATIRAEYRLGSGLFRVYGEGGLQAKYTLISYPDTSAPNESLYGPYIKLGLRYAS